MKNRQPKGAPGSRGGQFTSDTSGRTPPTSSPFTNDLEPDQPTETLRPVFRNLAEERAFMRVEEAKIAQRSFSVENAAGDIVVVDPENLSNDARETYLAGQCGALAVAFAEQHGWDIGIVIVEEDEWGCEADDNADRPHGWRKSFMPPDAVPGLVWGPETFVGHIVAISPDGLDVVDIDGDRDVEGFVEEWRDRHNATFARIANEHARSTVQAMEHDAMEYDGGLVPQNYDAAHAIATTFLSVGFHR